MHAAEDPEELLIRVAQAAVGLVAGSERAGGALPAVGEGSTAAVAAQAEAASSGVLSIPFQTSHPDTGDDATALLHIHLSASVAFEETANEIGFILAAHAALAARAVGD